MLHEAITSKKYIKVTLKVTACESSNGIEYERVDFYTCNNLDAAELEDAISHISGCREMYHFLYDHGLVKDVLSRSAGVQSQVSMTSNWHEAIQPPRDRHHRTWTEC